MKTILVTGGAGFIGSAYIRFLLSTTDDRVINVDKLTYAASLDALEDAPASGRYVLEKVDICDQAGLAHVFDRHRPGAVVHLAAESHVDRSIDGPSEFVQTNVVGTYTLLEAALKHWTLLKGETKTQFRFHHVSTDEVYGSLGTTGLFTETTPYAPNSPYSASKASSDHLVRAWHRTYGLPIIVTNCSNNYGPYQFPEKLIPLMILNALEGKPLPVYGRGENIRDWLHVEDHARALRLAQEKGRIGEQYNLGGTGEHKNLAVVEMICDLLDEMSPNKGNLPHRRLISFVEDRPGHDHRYAIDASKARRELGWTPKENLESGLRKTVSWYLDHLDWCRSIQARGYARTRLGLQRKVAQ